MRKGVALPNRTRRFTLQERKRVVKLCSTGKRVEVRVNGSPAVKLISLPQTQEEMDEHRYKFRALLDKHRMRHIDTETRKWIQMAEVGVPLSELIALYQDDRLCPAA